MFWENQLPHFLTTKRCLRDTIIFTAIYALIFINAYTPFGVAYWFKGSQAELLFYSSGLILTGIFFLVVSRIVMYHYHKKRRITIGLYGIWLILEIASMASVYAVEIMLVLKDPRPFIEILVVSLQNTSLLLVQPYIITILYFSLQDAKQSARRMEHQLEKKTKAIRLVHIKDENGTLRFSFKPDDLLYIESADNYVKINYLLNGKITQEVLRNTLKRMETMLEEFSVIRCHRSYMVNVNHISAVQKDKDGHILLLDYVEGLHIPVSKTYSPLIMRTFMSKGP